jgi:hypothetical protein
MIWCRSQAEGKGVCVSVVSKLDFVCIFQAKGAEEKE